MKYYVEFKLYQDVWERWREIDCQNSPEAVLIKIIQVSKIRSYQNFQGHQSLKKIDKNLYKYINFTGGKYYLRIQVQANDVTCDFDCLDWIPIGEEITIEKLNSKFISIDWNLVLLK